MRTLGIVAHSYEGGALCFLTACREGAKRLGPHLHPTIVMSAIPMGRNLDGWASGEHEGLIRDHTEGVERVAAAGADFFVCPDNTSHILLERIVDRLPLPGLHIAHVVCAEIERRGWKRVGLLGTKFTMTGPVYERALAERGMERLIPGEATREVLNTAIFDELCLGIFEPETVARFLRAIEDLKGAGAECVILGCTEIPLIVSDENSPLPVLDSTRLLARYAVCEALASGPASAAKGWLEVRSLDS